MERIVDRNTMDIYDTIKSTRKKMILYTVSLWKIFSVLNLVEAFQNIRDTDAEFLICGFGAQIEILG